MAPMSLGLVGEDLKQANFEPIRSHKMSLPSIVHIFEASLRTPPGGSFDELIRSQLDLAAREVATTTAPAPPRREPKTLYTDVGEYLYYAARLWAQLTENLVQGSHMDDIAFAAHEHTYAHSRMGDVATVVNMDVERSKLCKVRELSERFSRDIHDVWRPKPAALKVESPSQQTAFSPFRNGAQPALVPAPDVDYRHREAQKMLRDPPLPAGQTSPRGTASGSDDSDDDDEQFSRIDMEALKTRGKGSYHCPKGNRCDKGGVDKEGNLVVFDRNSSFAIATNIVNPGGAMYLDAQTHLKSASLRAEMA